MMQFGRQRQRGIHAFFHFESCNGLSSITSTYVSVSVSLSHSTWHWQTMVA